MGKILGFLVVICAVFVGYFIQQHHFQQPNLPPIRDEFYGSGAKRADNEKIQKFQINISDSILDDLQERLARTKFSTPSLEDTKWTYGINSEFLKKVHNHWRNVYDWRKHEELLNKWDHFKTEIEGLQVHFVRAKPPAGKFRVVRPLLLVHGWPGSVWEFWKILPLLTDPPEGVLPRGVGGAKKLAFEVIAPSIPGYGWSQKPQKAGFGPIAAARIFAKLMKRLKFDHYYCQGGDWGSVITSIMALMYPDRVLGLHLNMAVVSMAEFPLLAVQQLLGSVFPYLSVHPSDYYKVYPLAEKFGLLLQETGYMHIQATKPDTVGFALQDSPLGLAAYILEKFSTWTHPSYREFKDGGLTRHWTLDELLTNVMIYWLTDTIVSSQRFYKECFRNEEFRIYQKAQVLVPTGAAAFPHEIVVSPRNHLAYKYRNITRYTDMPSGGHFAAFEQPELLAADIFGFVSDLEK